MHGYMDGRGRRERDQRPTFCPLRNCAAMCLGGKRGREGERSRRERGDGKQCAHAACTSLPMHSFRCVVVAVVVVVIVIVIVMFVARLIGWSIPTRSRKTFLFSFLVLEVHDVWMWAKGGISQKRDSGKEKRKKKYIQELPKLKKRKSEREKTKQRK